MTKQKQYAFNTQLFFVIALLIVFLVLSICSAIENEVGLSIGFAVATLLPVFVFLISPLYTAFSDEEIEIVYILGQREIIKWKYIRCIYLNGSWISRGGGLPHYEVAYPTNVKRAFFVRGEIPKTRKTKKYIKMYYKKDIV
ncbi:MAG: hypothetical protein IJY65_01285 [Clostridia bacterium]|nr:hypothetical protein [Clostridia bacterium]